MDILKKGMYLAGYLKVSWYLAIALIVLVSTGSVIYANPVAGTLQGSVLDERTGASIPGATIWIVELDKGSSTNEEGNFEIKNLSAGRYQVQVTAVGYQKTIIEVEILAGEVADVEILMRETLFELDQVVVTGTMRETYIKDSPVKVSVVSENFLRKNPTNSLMESVGYINGLYNQVDCAVCGTSNIRINGMEGPYTAVLVDGMPIMGSLASVYGLDGLNPSLIETIEIIKGPNSTLYGSEAMGGVVNIRTKSPGSVPVVSLDASTTTHVENNLDIAVAPETENFHTLFSGSLFYFDRFLDHNNDNFADVTKRNRVSLFNKWKFNRPESRAFDLAMKYYYEDRLGGTESFTRDLRGSGEVYGEAIETNRFELMGRYELPFGDLFRVDYSFTYHDQDSYYGDYRYEAVQKGYFANLIWDKQFSFDRQLLVGGTLRHDALDQTFNNQRLENGSVDKRFTPGLFAQYEQIFNSSFRGLMGLRVDHHKDHGFITSPRMNLKWNLTDHTTARLNAGTGFRIVNLFTEEHEALTGSREVVITENLEPERSFNATLNLNQIVDIGTSVLNVDIDAFYTHFTNQIIPDYEFENEIRYANLSGYSVSRGLSVSAAHNFPGPLLYTAGVTFQDVFQKTSDEKQSLLFAPDFSAVFTFSYAFPSLQTSIDYTGRVVGKMELPEYEGIENPSEVYTEQNVKIARQIKENFELYASVKNLFNYTQKNPLIAPDRPFSDDFATDHVYGPLQGRRVMMGIRYEL